MKASAESECVFVWVQLPAPTGCLRPLGQPWMCIVCVPGADATRAQRGRPPPLCFRERRMEVATLCLAKWNERLLLRADAAAEPSQLVASAWRALHACLLAARISKRMCSF